MDKGIEMKPKFGVCGIYCELCPLYRDEKCKGCMERPPCPIVLCAINKSVECCFECGEFPCEIHYEEGKVYTKESLDNWKELMKKPKEWFIQIEEERRKK